MRIGLRSIADRRLIAAAVLAVVLLGPAARAQDGQFDRAALIRSLIPTVVNITARAEIAEPPDPTQASASRSTRAYQIRVNVGSGFIIDPSGLIATNWHVVVNAFEILVTFSDGSHAPAELVNAARVVDLALLKVDVDHKLPTIRWGDSSKVQIGDPVLAMGNALGIGMSVSAGIVSALNRNISDTPYDDFIQTDAAINHGNSGGPLFDMQGEVVGVNSAIISPTAANAGLGFAMPSNDAKFVFDRLVAKQEKGDFPRPAWLGVKIQALTADMEEALGTELHVGGREGSIIAAVVAGGPAEKAGLTPGDVIVRFDGIAPSDDRMLLRLITAARPHSTVTVGIMRDGKPMDVSVTLGEWPQMMWERTLPPPRSVSHLVIAPDLGLKVVPLTEELRVANDIQPGTQGALVTAVTPGSDAARRGVARGDVVIQVGRSAVRSAQDLQRQIDQVRREGRTFGLFLLLPKRLPSSNAEFPGPKWYALRVATR